jgi:spore coat protein U-like protein
MYTGAGAGATETIRYMTGPGGVELSYRLFTDSARTNNWANVAPYWVTGNGNATVTVWGQIPSGQAVPSGTYTDTMTTATTQFTVSVVITNTCSISASNLNFGTYQGAVIDATSAITVNCTALAPFNIGLNAGNGNGATVTLRKMTGPRAATLNYTLYRDSAHSLIWGNTVGTNTLSASGTGSAVQYPVYGRIPAGTVPAAGSYTDTITVTLTY